MPAIVRNEERDIRTSDVPDLKTFQRSERHIDFTAYDMSERGGVRLSKATRILNKTTQNFF